MPTCKIQWVDDTGKPTPDDNPAIGYAVYKRWEHSGATLVEERYAICAEHLKSIPHGFEHAYYPGTGETTSTWAFEPLED